MCTFEGLVKKIAPAVAGLGMLAGASNADAALITDIKNYYDPSASTGRIEFNVYDTDPNKDVLGIKLKNFFGGDLAISDVVSYGGDDLIFNEFYNLGNHLLIGDLNLNGDLNASLLYNNPRELNIDGNSILGVSVNNGSSNEIFSNYSVENIKETSSVPAPSSALLLASGLAGFGYSRKRKNSKKE